MDPNQGLASTSQGTSFAYNANNGHPYHKLGTPVDGYGTISEMLKASNADYEVELGGICAFDQNGNLYDVNDHFATMCNTSDGMKILGVVGKGYVIEQNREAAEFAYDCVGASHGDAVIDTMGVMKNGSEFFTYLRLEPLVLDPQGVKDELEMGLAVRTSHNGSVSLCAYPTAIRLVCRNSVTMSFNKAKQHGQLVKVRHTKNKTSYKADAVRALGMAAKVREDFIVNAQVMMQAHGTFNEVRYVANHLWPINNDPSPRAATIHENRIETLHHLWLSEKNSGGFGETLWSAWQTIGEYLDHHRGLTPEKRAYASLTPESSINVQKRKAAQILLGV